jgi:cytochrome c oxidase subunit 3
MSESHGHLVLSPKFHAERRNLRAMGMWLFLASEVMFFTAFFGAYIVVRSAAVDSIVQPLNKALGALNTLVLITSSLTMALAVVFSKRGDRKATGTWLAATFLLACAFMVVKAFEYSHHFHEGVFPSSDIFHAFYYLLTGFHGLHVLGGMIALGILWYRNRRGDFDEHYCDPIEMTGLYWHFVDLVWIFLFPALYLL